MQDKVNFKFCDTQPGKKTNVIHILPCILRSKKNQTIKIGQLMENNSRDIFVEISYTKRGGEFAPRPLS